MAFESQDFLLLYYISDKKVTISHREDVPSWNIVEFDKLVKRRRVVLKVEYECVTEKVCAEKVYHA